MEFTNFSKSDAVTSNTVCKLKWQTFLSVMAGSQCSIASHSYTFLTLRRIYIVHRIVNKSLKFANTYTNIHIIYVTRILYMYVPYVIVDISFRCLLGFSNFTRPVAPRGLLWVSDLTSSRSVYMEGSVYLKKKKSTAQLTNVWHTYAKHLAESSENFCPCKNKPLRQTIRVWRAAETY